MHQGDQPNVPSARRVSGAMSAMMAAVFLIGMSVTAHGLMRDLSMILGG